MNLEDPLVHDDDGDVEAPPLKDGEHRAQGAQAAVLHVLSSRLSLRERRPTSSSTPVQSPQMGGERESARQLRQGSGILDCRLVNRSLVTCVDRDDWLLLG
jgi:hypothetical protein